MNFIKNTLCLVMVLVATQLLAQAPAPGAAQSKPILIKNVTAHLGDGGVIENAFVAFDNGKITAVSNQRMDETGFEVMDGKGQHLYPGFISPNSQLGLTEIDAVRATRDNREVGFLNPHVRSIIAYNTDSNVTPTVRSNGILIGQITPQGGRVSGQSTIVQFDAWNWEDAAIKTDDGIHLNWPRYFSYNWRARKIIANDNYAKDLQQIEDYILEAKAYTKKSNPADVNLKFEAMKGLFDETKQLFVHTNGVKEMQQAVLFGQKHNLKVVIMGGRDSWMIADFLAKNNVPVALRSTQALPSMDDSDIDQPFKTAKQLQDAGVLFCFMHDGGWAQRNLHFQAGQAVGFGLAYEDAIKALTSNSAKILGIDKMYGSIEVGKSATLFLSEGDALDMRTSIVTTAFIDGRKIDVDNLQKQLFRRFEAKYNK